MINPNLDIPTLAKSFNVDKRLEIKDFLQVETAERLRNICLKEVPFRTQYVLNGQYQSKTPDEMAKLSRQEDESIKQQILTAASKGVGFLYQGYLKSQAHADLGTNSSDDLAFLVNVFDSMGSGSILEPIKLITANQEINGAEPQCTRFTSGDFLTRHLDIVPGRGRRYAFVLGLTKGWHPDWGGLLQFYQRDGMPRDAWMPQFNTLSIFEVSHVHAVTYVTPYANQPRLSLTGWFVAKN